MSILLCHERATFPQKVSVLAAVVALLLVGCDRPTPPGAAPGGRAEPVRTPRTRSTAGVQPPPTVDEARRGDGAVTLSLAADGHILDCRTRAYHPAMQTALAAKGAALRCAADDDGLVLQARSETPGAPPLAVATLREIGGSVELRWTEGVDGMECAPAKALSAMQEAACGSGDVAIEGMTIRRIWP
ncbi:MAG: hypothetical protein ABIK09_03040 [Pseudomonadota bacterium]